MLAQLFSNLRYLSRRLRQRRQRAALDHTDREALARQAPPDPRRVLVVRHDSIGDYLLYRPWLRQLSHEVRSRGQHLTLLANAAWAPLAQAWDGELADELLAVDFGRFRTDLAYRAALLRQLGAAGFGEIINPLHVREPRVENFIRFLRAPVRVASQGEHRADAWFAELNAGYTHLLPAAREVLFEYDRNREFFAYWQAQFSPPPPVLLAPPAPLRLPAAVHEAGAAEAGRGAYLLLFPGASARQKRWPAQHFGQLARALRRHYGPAYRLVVAGSAEDDAHARALLRAAGPGVPIENRCGQTDLPGLAALTAGARLVVSNDTVTAHLAAQAGTPALVLLMGENYGKFFPYPPALLRAPCRCLFPPSQEVRFAQGDFSPPARTPALGQLAPARVLQVAQEMLENA